MTDSAQSGISDISESSLMTFIDSRREHAVHLIDAQKLIADLVTVHSNAGKNLNFFRELIIYATLLTALLKKGERLSVYFDNTEPDFKFKVETGFDGNTRCLLLPEGLTEFPAVYTGKLRVIKFNPESKTPYTSVTEIEESTSRKLGETLMNTLYQLPGFLSVSDLVDFGALVIRLPLPEKENSVNSDTIKNTQTGFAESVLTIASSNYADKGKLISEIASDDLKFLAERNIQYSCDCSEERVMLSLCMLPDFEVEEEFKHSDPIGMNCDYCKTSYSISGANFNDFKRKLN